MAVFLWSIIILSVATLLHLAWWRVRIPLRQTRSLLLLYFGILAAGLALVHFAPVRVAALGLPVPTGLPELFAIILFVTSFALAYINAYAALEVDSPSLVMVMKVAKAGESGIPKEEFEREVSDDILVKPRVRDLIRDGMIEGDEFSYRLTEKGRRFISIFIISRAVLGGGKGG